MANSPARSVLDVGSVIADTYTIEALIGRGGMGAVFVASHKRLPGKQVAIKLLHADMQDSDVMTRFRHEAEIASRLGHPNIVAVHDFNVTDDGTPYLVLEYLRGESLDRRIANGPLPLEHVLSIARQVGSALAAAHREGIVHRDLKPQNIFLVPTEVDGRVVEIAKVLDFGISKIRGSQTVKTQDSLLLGTPQYMAPEQARGEQFAVDERTDVFAFGAIVYEMLSGQPAFTGASIPEVVFRVVYETPLTLSERAPTTPPPIVAAIERAMAKSADDRHPTAAAFVEALTGQPLSQLLVPPTPSLGFAAGSRVRSSGKTPIRDDDAFAQTSAPPSGVADARTTSADDAATVAKQAPRVRRPWLPIVLVACGSAVAAAFALYVTLGSSPTTGAGADPDAATSAARSAPIDANSGRVAEPRIANDAGPIAAKPPPSKPPRPSPRVDREPTVPVAEPRGGDDTLAATLADAEAALASQDFDRAERLATSVINGRAGAGQAARAHAVRGAVRCAAGNNEEGAQIDLRAIGSTAARQRLLSVCHKYGFLESVRQ